MKQIDNPWVHVEQFEPEFPRLLEIYKRLQPKTVLEIGSNYGGTLWYWLHNATPGAKLVNIDPMMGKGGPFDFLRMWQSWCPPGVELHTIVGYSWMEEAKQHALDILGEEIDFLFIDGDHTYRGVANDWKMYAPVAKVVAFHDLVQHKPHFGVWKLWKELKEVGFRTEELWSNPGGRQNGGGIGVLYRD